MYKLLYFCQILPINFIDNVLSMLYFLSTRILIFDIDFRTPAKEGVHKL